MFENLGIFRIQLSSLASGKLEKLDVKKSGKKSEISEVSEESEFSTWTSRSAKLYCGICGGKMATAIFHVPVSLKPRGARFTLKDPNIS